MPPETTPRAAAAPPRLSLPQHVIPKVLNGNGGIEGLLWALFTGLSCALALLGWRFAVVSRQPLRPV